MIRFYKTVKSRYHVSVFFFLLIDIKLFMYRQNYKYIYNIHFLIFNNFSGKLCKVLFYFRFHFSVHFPKERFLTTFIKCIEQSISIANKDSPRFDTKKKKLYTKDQKIHEQRLILYASRLNFRYPAWTKRSEKEKGRKK